MFHQARYRDGKRAFFVPLVLIFGALCVSLPLHTAFFSHLVYSA